RLGKGKPDHPLHTEGRVDGYFVRNLVCGSAANGSTVAHVWPFGSLTNDEEVHLAGRRKRARHAGVHPGRPKVDVVIKRKPQAEQQAAFDVGVLEPRVTGHSTD